MRWRKHHEATVPRVPEFVQCAACTYNFVTGEGTRNCHWGDCPYLPEQYKVFCPRCNYNFATGEGAPDCSDPPSCQWALEGYEHAALAKARFGAPDATARAPVTTVR